MQHRALLPRPVFDMLYLWLVFVRMWVNTHTHRGGRKEEFMRLWTLLPPRTVQTFKPQRSAGSSRGISILPSFITDDRSTASPLLTLAPRLGEEMMDLAKKKFNIYTWKIM